MPTSGAEDGRAPGLEELISLDSGQRVVATDPVALRRAVQALQAKFECLEADLGRVTLLRRIGSGLTALGDHAEARRVLEQALELACGLGDVRAEVAVRINLGDALRYGGELAASGPHYELALRTARRSAPDRVDFALQHYGKYFLDAGQPDRAEACLREALRLRQAKGDPELIRSTADTLALISARRAHGGG